MTTARPSATCQSTKSRRRTRNIGWEGARSVASTTTGPSRSRSNRRSPRKPSPPPSPRVSLMRVAIGTSSPAPRLPPTNRPSVPVFQREVVRRVPRPRPSTGAGSFAERAPSITRSQLSFAPRTPSGFEFLSSQARPPEVRTLATRPNRPLRYKERLGVVRVGDGKRARLRFDPSVSIADERPATPTQVALRGRPRARGASNVALLPIGARRGA